MITAVEKIVVMAMMMRLEHQVNQEKQVFYFLMEVSHLYETSLNILRHYLTNQALTIFQDQLLKWLISQIIQFQ